MCLGSIEVIVETWEEDGAEVGRLEGGAVVPLAFVPGARAGVFVLLHLGVPVEVLEPDTARAAQELRSSTDTETAGGPP